jgi:uroporphyrinogen decarboxylase
MNIRERFLATMAFEPVDCPPLWEWDYWPDTLRRWRIAGAPLRDRRSGTVTLSMDGEGRFDPYSTTLLSDVPFAKDARLDFKLDAGARRVPLNSFICPLFEHRVLEERGDVVISQDERGHIRADKKGRSGIYNILKPLVASREDWEQVKAERLQLNLKGRLPESLPKLREEFKRRDFALAIGGHSGLCGIYHPTRLLMGPQSLLYALHDQPDLVRDIMTHLADLQIYLFDKVLSEIDVDFCLGCEDLGFKSSSFISPAMFREFLLPCYRRLTGMLRDHGVQIMIVDSDGYNWDLIPLFLEGGATGMGPMEVAADMDVVEVRKVFPRLQIFGGIDKRIIASDRNAIQAELARIIPPLVSGGGYIPHCDHSVPPDVSWESFSYYRKTLAALARRTQPQGRTSGSTL